MSIPTAEQAMMAQMQATLAQMQAKIDQLEADKAAGNRVLASTNLLRSTNRTSDKSPHFFGTLEIDGTYYDLAMWDNPNRNSDGNHMHLTLSAASESQIAREKERQAKYQAGLANTPTAPAAPVAADEPNSDGYVNPF